MNSPPSAPSPRRVAAGKLNRAKRKGLTAAGAERLRQAALAHRPWEKSTGPRTPEGKAKVAANGLKRAVCGESARAARRAVASLSDLFAAMAAARYTHDRTEPHSRPARDRRVCGHSVCTAD